MKKLFSVCCLVLGLVASAQADQGDESMIVIAGAGAEATSANSDVNVLIRLGYSIAVEKSPRVQYIFARIRGDLTVNPASGQVPYFDIEFKPVTLLYGQHVHGDPTKDAAIRGLGINFVPLSIRRDVRVDQWASMSLSVAGVELGARSSGQAGLYAQLAMDVLGYKLVSYASEGNEMMHMARVGGARGELGAFVGVDRTFRVEFGVGGRADANFAVRREGLDLDSNPGTTSVPQRGFQSDAEIYAEIRALIGEMVGVFLRTSAIRSTARFSQAEQLRIAKDYAYEQLMAGVYFKF